jgi:hypothetical protein
MADNTVEPKRQAGAGSAVSQGSGELADDIAGQVRGGSPTSTPGADYSRSAAGDHLGQWPLPRRVRPHSATLDDSRGHTNDDGAGPGA